MNKYTQQAAEYQRSINQLNQEIAEAELKYKQSLDKQANLEKYRDFLISVCKHKEHGGEEKDNSAENDIEQLRKRFVNLKKESLNLKKRKAKINEETEKIRKQEKDRIAVLNQEYFEKQQQMQRL